jgi:alpha-glucosidase (family GH31 glycosyl hydrolase)
MKGENTIQQKIWLPRGFWYDYRNNNMVTGGSVITQTYALDEIPVFVKAGSIIPTQPAKTRVMGTTDDTIILTVYPDYHPDNAINVPVLKANGHANFSLYEDDGTTENYKQTDYRVTNIDYYYHSASNSATLTILPTNTQFNNMPTERAYVVRIANRAKPAHVKINNIPVQENRDWTYDTSTNILVIKTRKEKISGISITMD